MTYGRFPHEHCLMKLATTDGCGGCSICWRPGVGTRGSMLLMERDTLSAL